MDVEKTIVEKAKFIYEVKELFQNKLKEEQMESLFIDIEMPLATVLGDMVITYKGIISQVVESEKMIPEESVAFIKKYEKELNLSKDQYDRWAGKKFLAVFEISNLVSIEPFKYNRENNMDDWIITDDINKIKA